MINKEYKDSLYEIENIYSKFEQDYSDYDEGFIDCLNYIQQQTNTIVDEIIAETVLDLTNTGYNTKENQDLISEVLSVIKLKLLER